MSELTTWEMQRLRRDEWISNLKVGDPVILASRYGDQEKNVTKITATQVVVESMRFKRQGGWQIGGNQWSTLHLEEPTPEARNKIEYNTLLSKAKDHNTWNPVSLEKLRAVFAVLEAP